VDGGERMINRYGARYSRPLPVYLIHCWILAPPRPWGIGVFTSSACCLPSTEHYTPQRTCVVMITLSIFAETAYLCPVCHSHHVSASIRPSGLLYPCRVIIEMTARNCGWCVADFG